MRHQISVSRFRGSGSLGQSGFFIKLMVILYLGMCAPVNALANWFFPRSPLGVFIASPYVKVPLLILIRPSNCKNFDLEFQNLKSVRLNLSLIN